jgi:hypothetical protein
MELAHQISDARTGPALHVWAFSIPPLPLPPSNCVGVGIVFLSTIYSGVFYAHRQEQLSLGRIH